MILREKILLGMVGVAAVGAGIFYAPALLNQSGTASPRPTIDFPALINKVQVGLKEGESTDREKQILAAATTKWLRNPLRDRPLIIEEQPLPVEAPSAEYIAPIPEYVGFLSIGAHLIAIIDGKDYRAGEIIEGGEFRLMKILPDHIKLLRRGASDPINVQLEKPHITGKSDEVEQSQNAPGASSSEVGPSLAPVPEDTLVPGPPPVRAPEAPRSAIPGVRVVPLPAQVTERIQRAGGVPSTRAVQ